MWCGKRSGRDQGRKRKKLKDERDARCPLSRRGALWCVLRPCGSIARQQLELVAVRACVQWSQYSAHARVEQRSRLARSMASAVVSFRKVHPWGIGRPGAPVAWVGRLCPRTRGQIALHFCALRDTPNIRTQHTAPQFVLLICVRYSSPLAKPLAASTAASYAKPQAAPDRARGARPRTVPCQPCAGCAAADGAVRGLHTHRHPFVCPPSASRLCKHSHFTASIL